MTPKKLEKPLKTKKKHQKSSTLRYNRDEITDWCPNCGQDNSLMFEGRCATCIACGWSQCEI